MEYVDGEDLASLLRRIGRIPQDKAIELARQLCAGVAAAHERGVLHRDLKPANVMIDGDGNVRITDFGIATAGGDAGAAVPARRSTWRRSSWRASRRRSSSDLYALGLILFEIFTGPPRLRREVARRSEAAPRHRHRHDAVVDRARSRSGDRAPDPSLPRQGSGEAARHRRWRSRRRCPAAIRSPRRWRPARRRRRSCSSRPAKARRCRVGRGLARADVRHRRPVRDCRRCARVRAVVGRSPIDKPPAVLVDRAQQIIAIARLHRRRRRLGLRIGARPGDYLQWISAQPIATRNAGMR